MHPQDEPPRNEKGDGPEVQPSFIEPRLRRIIVCEQSLNASIGQGIGKQLVQHAIDYTIENGWSKLKLSTRPWNRAMRKVCTGLGFTQEAHLRKEYLDKDLIQYGYFPQP